MPTIHTIQQGETLTRIAKRYKFSSWKDLYNHPDNAEFRALRDNPDIVFAGDSITIPDPEPQKASVKAGASYNFQLNSEKEKLILSIGADASIAVEGKKAILDIEGNKVETFITKDGNIEVELPEDGAKTGQFELYLDDDIDEPSHTFELEIGHLDPIEELSGIQARCNALGFDCGVVDGIMGSKTREGIEDFQEAYELDVDGEPSEETITKLKNVYGC